MEQHVSTGSDVFRGRAFGFVVTYAVLAGDEDHASGAGGGDEEGVVPGAGDHALGGEAVRVGGDVNYEGTATSLDWDAAGDVTSGFVAIWQYTADGKIEDIQEIPFSLD